MTLFKKSIQLISFILSALLISFSTFSQNPQSGPNEKDKNDEVYKKQIERNRQRFEQMQSQIDRMMKKFEKNFGHGFLEDDFDSFFKKGNPNFKDQQKLLKKLFQGQELSQSLDHKWIDKGKTKELHLFIQKNNQSPLDIKIEAGKLTLKGEMIKKEQSASPSGDQFFSTSKSYIEKTLSLPDDVDETKAKFNQFDDVLVVSFPVIEGQKKKIRPKLKIIPHKKGQSI